MCKVHDPRVEHLGKLAAQLSARGVQCELLSADAIPRLRLDIPWSLYCSDDEFQDHVLASSEPDGIWRFWWPYIDAIGPVEDIDSVVEYIHRNTMATFEPDIWNDDESQDPKDTDQEAGGVFELAAHP